MTSHPLLQKFEKVFIDKSSLDSDVALRVFKLFPRHRIQVCEGKGAGEPGPLPPSPSPSQMDRSKKQLFLTSFKGRFFKRCPGARPGLVCCNYFVLNLASHCEMDCSYCYLQSFVNFSSVVIYTNIEQAFKELDEIFLSMADQKLRVGTGEITDSLSLDDLTLYSRQLVRYFKKRPLWTLEFKTKSDNVKNFLSEGAKPLADGAKPLAEGARPLTEGAAGNVIISWSVNPEFVVTSEEHGTASLKQRLKAACQCRDKGWSVAFHIDPVIYHPGWRENYHSLVRQITSLFSPGEVSHISLGALRFQASQSALMHARFGMKSLVNQGEFFKSKDGKLRYDRGLRNQMFHFIKEAFKKHSREWRIFLCMEDRESWLQSQGGLPYKSPALGEMFHPRVVRTVAHHRLQKDRLFKQDFSKS